MPLDRTNLIEPGNPIGYVKEHDPNLETLLDKAKQQDGDALFIGSLILLGGFDLALIDELEATDWTRRGASLRHPACSIAYGIHLHSGYAIGRAKDADRYVLLGKKWLLDATADRNRPYALMLRALVEEAGLGGFRRSKINAERLVAAAAELADPFGQFKYGEHYEQRSKAGGHGRDQNAMTALEFMRLSAEQGYAGAQRRLSTYFLNGFGTQKDPEASVTWLFKAAKQHHPLAALEAGYWCLAQSRKAEEGSEEPNRLLDEMVRWYRIAARNGQAMAEIALAYCSELGLGMEQNMAAAYSAYHGLVHRDGKTFATRTLNKQEMDHVRRRMSLLRSDAETVERQGKRLRMVWGEDEIVITEEPQAQR
jgi:TPR repeat protein